MTDEPTFDFSIILDGLRVSITELQALLIIKENRTSFLELNDPAFNGPIKWEVFKTFFRQMVVKALEERNIVNAP